LEGRLEIIAIVTCPQFREGVCVADLGTVIFYYPGGLALCLLLLTSVSISN
jgi:hypothetical protein